MNKTNTILFYLYITNNFSSNPQLHFFNVFLIGDILLLHLGHSLTKYKLCMGQITLTV